MAQSFGSMSAEEQKTLANKVSACLKENGLDVPVQIYREEVASLKSNEV